MPSITPFLWFDDQAEAAMHHYVSIFPNSRVVNVARYGPGTPRPEGMVMTATFELDGQEFTALNGGPEYTFTEAISFMVPCESQAEVDHYWERLGDGGQPGPCGWLKDRYGISWQIVPTVLGQLMGDPDPERAGRATQAMLQMSKLDIAALQRAADGA